MTAIANKDLQALDAEVSEFYATIQQLWESKGNRYGQLVYRSKLEQILERASTITPDSPFDALILRNIHSNLRIQDEAFRFVIDVAYDKAPLEFIDVVGGTGAAEYLQAVPFTFRFYLHG